MLLNLTPPKSEEWEDLTLSTYGYIDYKKRYETVCQKVSQRIDNCALNRNNYEK